jgi:predicted lipoprotein with Yx(FWY)xxD motif
MKQVAVLLLVGLLALAGCGDDSDSGAPAANGDGGAAPADTAPRSEPEAGKTGDGGDSEDADAADGTAIELDKSEFGPMLFDSEDQAIYIFENDPKGKTVCYGECAAAWPPVFTDGEPQAGKGVRQSLLGTVKRRDGKLQATYAGKPLYYYAHEQPGEVRCHNVNLNGGFWWVVGADGKRRP